MHTFRKAQPPLLATMMRTKGLMHEQVPETTVEQLVQCRSEGRDCPLLLDCRNADEQEVPRLAVQAAGVLWRVVSRAESRAAL